MREVVAVVAAVVVILVAAAQGRAVDETPDVDVDVYVVGHSDTQLNATRYDVQRAQVPNRAEEVQAPIVTIKGLGAVKGRVTYTEQGKRPIYQYLGVPFAEAPVGERRFVAPVPKEPWTDVRDASTPGKICIQVVSSASAIGVGRRLRRDQHVVDLNNESEDCLILDIHTPKVDPSAKLPVLVFVHGGAFHYGSAGTITPQGILDEDVVLVSPQYRLGPLGFLNLQTDEVPGNAGLMDLVEALRWVNKHISHFGGDPSRVTLGGHSAGAALVSVLSLSPLTKGLIHSVMPMSGSALSFWAWDRYPDQANAEITMAALCATPTTSIQDRVACLRKIPATQLVLGYGAVVLKTLLNGGLGLSGSAPSVQRAPGAVHVLPDWPENVMSSKNFRALPYLTGVTKNEGTYPLEIAEAGYLNVLGLTKNTSFVRNDMMHVLMKVIWADDSAGFVADAAIGAFLDPSTLGDYAAMRDGIIDILGAFGFKSPARSIVQRIADLGQASYLYAFNHNGAITQNSPEGIFHGADQPYLWPRGDPMTGDDLKIALALRKLVTNFVIYQNPTPSASPVTVAGIPSSWPRFHRDSEKYLELVWPPSNRQWFRSEYTVTRRDGLNGGSATSGTTKGSTSATTNSRSHDPNAAAAPLPTAALTLAVVLVTRWSL